MSEGGGFIGVCEGGGYRCVCGGGGGGYRCVCGGVIVVCEGGEGGGYVFRQLLDG